MNTMLGSQSKGRGYGQFNPSIYQRNPGVSLAKGAFSYNNNNQHNNGNSSVHKEYRGYNQISNNAYSGQYKDTPSSKIQLSSYEKELEERKEKERAQNAYRIR